MNRVQFAFDTILQIDRAKSADELLGHINKAATQFGFDCFCVAGIPSIDPFDALLHNWPTGWLRRYLDGDYIRIDPVIRKLRRTTRPFMWSDAPYKREESGARKVMTEATEFQLRDGLCIPIYTSAGDYAGVSFGGQKIELCDEDRAALQLIAIYGHAKARDLLRPRPIEIEIPTLTRRELEILKYCADGATTRAIGDKLSISEETVQTHVANAARKLNVGNRCAAVASALRLRLIS